MKNEIIVIPLIFFILLGGVYHGILYTYAFTDDYEFLLNASNENFLNVFIQGGRPIFGLVLKWAFITFDSLQELKFIRLFGLFGAFLLTNVFYIFLRKSGFTILFSLLASLLLISSPSFGIKIGWTLAYAKPYFTIIALLSGVLITEYIKKQSITLLICSILFGVSVLLLYQPLYTFSLIPLVVYWIKNPDLNKRFILKFLLLHIIIYVIYFFIYKFSLYYFDLQPLGRTGIDITSLFNKIEWFWADVFKRALVYNFIFAPNAIQWIIRVTIFLSIIYILWFKKKNYLINFLFLLIVLHLSMLPNIVSSDSWVSYRTMGTLISVMVLLMVFAIDNIGHNKMKRVAGTFIMLVMICMAFYNFNFGFIKIQKNELSMVKSELHRLKYPTELFFVQPPVDFMKKEGYLKRVIGDEYGRLSSSSDWVPDPMVKLLYKTQNKDISVIKVVTETDKENVVNVAKLYKTQNWSN